MTTSRYIFARIAQAFGYVRKGHRMSEAASEMHLLREAETYLGMRIWPNVEPIDALSVEYWNLRKLIKERDSVNSRLEECHARLTRAHEERATLINAGPSDNQELLAARAELLAELEQLALRRDAIVAEAREVRRSFTGLKTKLEVLAGELRSDPGKEVEMAEVKRRILEVRERFDALRTKREEIGREIEEGDAKLDVVDEQLRHTRQERREKASEAFHEIGEGNKEVSALRAESGLIELRMRQLYSEIGRHVSRNAHHDEACAAAAKSYQGLIEIMRALRRSIDMNYKLAGTI